MSSIDRLVASCGPVVLLVCLSAPGGAAGRGDLTAADVVARHLAAIGRPDAVAAAASRTAPGEGMAVSRLGGYGQVYGPASVVSEGRRTRIEFSFGSNEYPGEVFVCDGEKVGTATYKPSTRSALASFVKQFDVVMKEGLLAGTLTTAWALLDVRGRRPTLTYNGLKKIDGSPVHELGYAPRKGSDLTVLLYFDAESFQHVRTWYRAVQPAGMAREPTRSSQMLDTRYTLVETFGAFRAVDGITLPHSYKVAFTMEGPNASFLADWAIVLGRIVNNTKLDPEEFAVP